MLRKATRGGRHVRFAKPRNIVSMRGDSANPFAAFTENRVQTRVRRRYLEVRARLEVCDRCVTRCIRRGMQLPNTIRAFGPAFRRCPGSQDTVSTEALGGRPECERNEDLRRNRCPHFRPSDTVSGSLWQPNEPPHPFRHPPISK